MNYTWRIDSHQHVWDLKTASYPWLSKESHPINGTTRYEQSLPGLRRAGMDGSILVQAADNADDTRHMLNVADDHAGIVAVVAWAPLDDPDEFGRALEAFEDDERIVGIRNLIHDRADPDWLGGSRVTESLRLLEGSRFTFDLVSVLPRHLEHLLSMGERFPNLRVVVDHLSKPPLGRTDPEPWWSLLDEIAQNPLVHAKVSGLYAAAPQADAWSTGEIRRWVDRAHDTFGADRLMYGGDWPICILAGGYDRMWDALSSVFDDWDAGSRDSVLGGTAKNFYRISDSALLRARGIDSAQQLPSRKDTDDHHY